MKTITADGKLIYADSDGCFVHHKGDKAIITHVKDVEPIFARMADGRKELKNGFIPGDTGRNMRFLGSVPLLTYLRNPDLANDKNLKAYLNNHPRCRVVPAHTF